MKVRLSYVSNSSSSSFVLIGKHMGNIEKGFNLAQFDFNKKVYYMFGGYLSEGTDLISLDEDTFDFIMQNKEKFDSQFDGNVYQVVSLAIEGTDQIDISKLNKQGYKKLKVLGGFIDMHSSDNVDDIKENYFN